MLSRLHGAPALKIPEVFRNRDFKLLFSARMVSQLGDQIYVFAISWYILHLTQSSLQMAVPLILNTVITTIISLFGGMIADRLDRKHIMVRTDILQGLILSIMVLFIYQNWMQIWMLYGFTVVLSFCSALFSPAASAVIPDIVQKKQLTEATSANQFTVSFCAMAGMLVGGALYALGGIATILISNAASNFASAAMESRLNIPLKVREKTKFSLKENIKISSCELSEGWRYVKQHTSIFHLLLANSVFNFIALPVGLVYIPYYFNVVLEAMPMHLAFPQATLWSGMIIAALFVPASLRRHKLSKLLWRGLIWMGLCTLLGIPLAAQGVIAWFTLWQISMVWAAINLFIGITVNLFTIPMYTLFHKHTANEYRGRFWGIENSLRALALCSGYFLSGLLAQKVWLGFLFASSALAMLAIGLWIKNLTSIQSLEENNLGFNEQV